MSKDAADKSRERQKMNFVFFKFNSTGMKVTIKKTPNVRGKQADPNLINVKNLFLHRHKRSPLLWDSRARSLLYFHKVHLYLQDP